MKKIICSCGHDRWISQPYGLQGTGTHWDIYRCEKCGSEHQVEVREDTIEEKAVELYEKDN